MSEYESTTQAASAARGALCALAEADLSGLPAEQLAVLLSELEHASRHLRAAQAHAVASLRAQQGARELGYVNERHLLTGHLALSPGHTRALLDDASRAGTPRMRALAGARLSSGQLGVVERALAHLPDDAPGEVRDELERRLLELAPTTTCSRLAAYARELTEQLLPGHTQRGEAERARRRSAVAGGQGPDLMAHASLTMDPELAALMREVHARWAQPGRLWPDESTPDDRTDGQRMHDALTHALRLALSADASRLGAPAAIVIRMNLDQLATLAGCGQTDGGIQVPVAQAIEMARGNHWFLALVDKNIELDLRRTRRTASYYQRLALFAAYGGCSHPDCDQDARHCEAHYADRPWSRGGQTDIGELGLVSGDCHAMIHDTGWSTTPDRAAPQGMRWRPPPGSTREVPPPPDKPGAPPLEPLRAPLVPFALLRDFDAARQARRRSPDDAPARDEARTGKEAPARDETRARKRAA